MSVDSTFFWRFTTTNNWVNRCKHCRVKASSHKHIVAWKAEVVASRPVCGKLTSLDYFVSQLNLVCFLQGNGGFYYDPVDVVRFCWDYLSARTRGWALGRWFPVNYILFFFPTRHVGHFSFAAAFVLLLCEVTGQWVSRSSGSNDYFVQYRCFLVLFFFFPPARHLSSPNNTTLFSFPDIKSRLLT